MKRRLWIVVFATFSWGLLAIALLFLPVAAAVPQVIGKAPTVASTDITPASSAPMTTTVIPTQTQPVVAAPSVLSLALSDTVPMGIPIVVTATLMNQAERPLPNKVLIVSLNAEPVRQVRTDEDGKAAIYLGP